MSDIRGDTFRVGFRGGYVDCSSLNDAVALINAEKILSNDSPSDQSPGQLDRTAELLQSYGETDAARAIAHLASRGRAMQYLVATVGYRRPINPTRVR